jgi:hypothetical protein
VVAISAQEAASSDHFRSLKPIRTIRFRHECDPQCLPRQFAAFVAIGRSAASIVARARFACHSPIDRIRCALTS